MSVKNKKKYSLNSNQLKPAFDLDAQEQKNTTNLLSKCTNFSRIRTTNHCVLFSSMQRDFVSLRPKRVNDIFLNKCFEKNKLKGLIAWSLLNFGEKITLNLVEKLKDLGFLYATQAGISISLDDLQTPPSKKLLVFQAELQVQSTQQEYTQGNLTALEKSQQLLNTWHRTSENLKQDVLDNFESTDILNPVYMMAFSGARGNVSQVRQLVGMRGLMADPQGQIIDFPIRSNFREGLTLTEYFISCYGARKGLVDTALRTANTGYLTRRLVDVSQHIIVGWVDCGTKRGMALGNMIQDNKTILPLQNRLLGRVLAKDIPPIAFKNQQISFQLAEKIAKLKTTVLVRSPLTCDNSKNLGKDKREFLCQLCYGWSLDSGKLVSLGEAVGVLAAQSIGEPGTQLTMRTFHTGGVFSGDIFDEIRAPFDGIIKFQTSLPGNLIRTSFGQIAFFSKNKGEFIIVEKKSKQLKDDRLRTTQNGEKTRNILKFGFAEGTLLFIRNAGTVSKGQLIAEFASVPQKKEQIQAEHRVISEIEGQVFIEEKNERFFERDEKKIATKLESIWLLSGKIYKSPVVSDFFSKKGDILEKNFVLHQSIGIVPDFFQSLGLNSSQIIKKKSTHLSLGTNKSTVGSRASQLKNRLVFQQLLNGFPLVSPQYTKIGYFFSLENSKSLPLRALSKSSKEKFFTPSALKKNKISFLKLERLEWSNKSVFYHWFPTLFQTQTAGFLLSPDNLSISNERALNNYLFEQDFFWVSEECFEFFTNQNVFYKNSQSIKIPGMGLKKRTNQQKKTNLKKKIEVPLKNLNLNGETIGTTRKKVKNFLVPHWSSSEKPFFYKKNRQAQKKPVFLTFSGFLQVIQDTRAPMKQPVKITGPFEGQEQRKKLKKSNEFTKKFEYIKKAKNRTNTFLTNPLFLLKFKKEVESFQSSTSVKSFLQHKYDFFLPSDTLTCEAKKWLNDKKLFLGVGTKLFRDLKAGGYENASVATSKFSKFWFSSFSLQKNKTRTIFPLVPFSYPFHPKSIKPDSIKRTLQVGNSCQIQVKSGWVYCPQYKKTVQEVLKIETHGLDDLIFDQQIISTDCVQVRNRFIHTNRANPRRSSKKILNEIKKPPVVGRETVILNTLKIGKKGENLFTVSSVKAAITQRLLNIKKKKLIKKKTKKDFKENKLFTHLGHLKFSLGLNAQKDNFYKKVLPFSLPYSSYISKKNTIFSKQLICCENSLLINSHILQKMRGVNFILLSARESQDFKIFQAVGENFLPKIVIELFPDSRHKLSVVANCKKSFFKKNPWVKKNLQIITNLNLRYKEKKQIFSWNKVADYTKEKKHKFSKVGLSESFPKQKLLNIFVFSQVSYFFENSKNMSQASHPSFLVFIRKVTQYTVLDENLLKKKIYSTANFSNFVFSWNLNKQKNTKLFSTKAANELKLSLVLPVGVPTVDEITIPPTFLLPDSADEFETKTFNLKTFFFHKTCIQQIRFTFSTESSLICSEITTEIKPEFFAISGFFSKNPFFSSYNFSAFCVSNLTKYSELKLPAKVSLTKPKPNFSQNTWILNKVPWLSTDFFSPFSGELAQSDCNSSCIIVTNDDILTLYIQPRGSIKKIQVGKLYRNGEEIIQNVRTQYSGQIIQIQEGLVSLRRANPILVSSGGVFHVQHNSFVEKNSLLFTLYYQIVKTGDIVQGIPKIEQLFEARETEGGQPMAWSLQMRLDQKFQRYKELYTENIAVRKSFLFIQKAIVQEIYIIYESQGVNLAEKHLEIIVRQMTSKVRVLSGGNTHLLRGEIVSLFMVERINLRIKHFKPSFFLPANYEPVVLGITQASLRSKGFLSAASFQETTRILSFAAIENRTDYLRGLKENVILGRLNPAGTGFPMWKWQEGLKFEPLRFRAASLNL